MKIPSGPSLYLALWRTSHAVMKADDASIAAAGFRSRTDFAVLEILLHKGPLTVNDIGKRVLLTSGSITTAVQRVESRGWVTRTPDPSDRRKVTISLTPAGRERIETAFAAHAERLDDLFSPLTDEEKGAFWQTLKKLRQHQEEHHT